MRIRTIPLAIALAAPVLLNGCGSDRFKPQNPQGEIQEQSNAPETARAAPSAATPVTAEEHWTLQLVSKCEDPKQLSTCAGAYGFRISQDGAYTVGPGPKGQLVQGFLAKDDLSALQAELGRSNGEPGKISELRDARVSNLLGDLARRYSPSQFPNPCVDADAELRALEDNARTCESDQDCSYLDRDFLPLDSERRDIREATFSDCTYVSALNVANPTLAVQLQRDLLLKRLSVEQTCGKARKTNCIAPRTLDPWRSAAACVEGKCKLTSIHLNDS